MNSKISKFILLLAALFVSFAAKAVDTTFDFSFTAFNSTTTNNGYLVLNGAGQLVSGGGTISGTAQTGFANGQYVNTDFSNAAMSNFALVSNSPWKFSFDANGIRFTVDYSTFNSNGVSYPGSISNSWDLSGNKITSSSGLVTQSPPTQHVPEIDGSKAPQAALLIGLVLFALSRRKSLKMQDQVPPLNGILTQPA